MESIEEKINNNCLIISDTNSFLKIEKELRGKYLAIHKLFIEHAISYLDKNIVSCIIIYVGNCIHNYLSFLKYVKLNFPSIFVIILLKPECLESSLSNFKNYIDYAIPFHKINEIEKIIDSIINSKKYSLSLDEFGINIDKCSSYYVKEGLNIITEKYLVFNNVKEITNFLGISESAFSKEFIKYFHLGPKKLLSILKLRYAIFLMKNYEMKLKEIAYTVGFKDVRRFNESFHNLLGLSPIEFKKNHSENDFKELLFSQKFAIDLIYFPVYF